MTDAAAGPPADRPPAALRPGAVRLPRPFRTDGPLLVLDRLGVAYDGHRAVDEVSISLAPGTVTGLIGPNGAGKTSLIDAVTGFVRYDGHVRFDGESLGGRAPHERVRRGLARTWQSVEPFDDLSLIESLRVAAEQPSARGTLLDFVRPARGDDDAWPLALLGLEALADRSPRELSFGQRKLAGVARALATNPKLVLMDEPAAGLDAHESRALGERIRRMAELGIGVLLVDHDIGLVLDVCDVVHVLDFGTLVASGTPAAVRAHPGVIAAYLGKGANAPLGGSPQ